MSQRTLDDLHRLHPETQGRPAHVVHEGGTTSSAWPAGDRSGPAVGFGHHSNKNPDLLLDAWALLAREPGGAPPLTLLGLSGARREEMTARVAALGLSDRIELAPFLPDEEFQAVLARADLIVFPSDFEGFGLPVVEGMTLGKPVVLGPDPATTEVAGGHAAVAADWTPAALADAVRRARAMTEADVNAARAWGATFTLGADDPADPGRTGRACRGADVRMSRLPHRFQPLWPLVKRMHRMATSALGVVFRRTSRMAGVRALPTRATERSADTAAGDPSRVVLHAGGPAEELVRAMPVGEPARHAAFDPWLRRTVSARYVLDVRDGLLVGDYAATIAPGGVLDYETSGYFGISGWRQHPLFLRPRLPEPRRVPGTLLSLATRGTSTNYYHFLLDLLPRWGIFEEACPGTEVDAIYLATRTSYQRQLLELVGLDRLPVVEVEKHACLAPDRLLVPSTPNQDLMAPRWVVEWLRAHLPATPDLSGIATGLYVTRGDVPNTRRYVEEEQLLAGPGRAGLHPARPGQRVRPGADRPLRGRRRRRRPARRRARQPGLRKARCPGARAVRPRLREPLLLGRHRGRPGRALPVPGRRLPRRDRRRRAQADDRRPPRHLHPPGPRALRSRPPARRPVRNSRQRPLTRHKVSDGSAANPWSF